MEWKTVKLGDILKITGGQLYKGDLLGTGDNLLLGMGCVSFMEKFLMKGARQYGGDCLDKNIGRPGDIVLATRQQSDNLPILAMPAIIPEGLPAKKIIIGSNLYKVNVIDSDFDNRFIYWLLKTPEYVNYISSVKTGTTVKMITIKDVESYTFLCPPKEIRDKISKLLWDLDDKIENNNHINRNLEAQAQALFKSWFVDFEPFGGTMPEDWKNGVLGEICKIKYGKGLSTNLLTDEGYPVFGGNGVIGYYSKFLYELPQILVSCRGAASGKIMESDPHSFVTSNSLVLEMNDRAYYYYLKYLLLANPLYNYATGSAQPQITIDNIKDVDIVLPSIDIVNTISEKFEVIDEQIRSLRLESQRLATLRDTLLPKLMKGEIAL